MSDASAFADEARRLRSTKMSWNAIAIHLRVSSDKVRYAIDPDFAVRRRERNTERRRLKRTSASAEPQIHRVDVGRVSLDEQMAAIASVPADTRDLTARLFGDPLPGRSALDLRNAKS